MLHGQLQHPILTSQALQSNRLGDPHVRPLTLYLPPAYDAARRYVTLYLLAAHGSTGQGMIGWRPWGENPIEKVDRLMAAGEMPPVIVVLPDSWTSLGGSQYLNSAMGNYETYLIDEIVPYVEARYPSAGRGVLGFSSGGYGALVQAMRHPDIFQAAACHAGDLYWEYTCLPNLAALHQALVKYGGAAQFLQDVNQIQPKSGTFWKTVMTLCWSMAHGTNPDSPLGFDLPIDETTGALNETVWQRWLTFDPIRMVDLPENQAALRRLKLLFIDAGLYDDFQLQVGARVLSQKLAALGIPHVHEEFPGGHTSSDIRFDRSMKLLAEALVK